MLIFAIFILFGYILLYNFYLKRRKFPPGPIPLPIFGNALEILKNEPGYEAFIKWSKKYGPMHTFWLGETPIVAITDYNMIVDLFVKDGDSYLGRQKTRELIEITRGGINGVILTEGDLWRDQRRFALHVFRNFGLGKNLMQERILVEISSLIEKVQRDIKSGIVEHNLANYIDVAVGSVINDLLFGYRFEEEKYNEFKQLKWLVADFMKAAGHPLVLMGQNVFKYYKYIFGLSHFYDRVVKSNQTVIEFYKRQIEEHIRRTDHSSEPTDYVEAFLREKARRENEGDAEFYTELQLVNMCFDLWTAGQETTSNTLAWGLLYVMQDNEVQGKLHRELDSVIGNDRIITMDDRPKLNYTVAVVNEIQRITNLLPLNVRRTTSRDVYVNGYHIPEGTDVLPHISVVLYDEKIFPNPYKFDPSRFLDENGNVKKVDELIPFSIGKRQCLGEDKWCGEQIAEYETKSRHNRITRTVRLYNRKTMSENS